MNKNILQTLTFAILLTIISSEIVKAEMSEKDACLEHCENEYTQARDAAGFQRNPGEPLGLAFRRHTANNPAFRAAVENYSQCKDKCNITN
ncbi:MAG: hypothetical protein K2P93_01475 [Alphaproteobacteria bacterium]|nr:hypothetical protein [Alphaproteobacteria bacterium]